MRENAGVMGEKQILPTVEGAVHAAAELVAALSRERAQSSFTVALAGGSTPRPLYQALAAPPYARSVDWARWQVFWGDERCVPPGHQESNYRMAREALLDRVPVPAGQVHRVRGEADPQEAAAEYEAAVRRVLGGGRPAFDLVLLGMGDDGHTASLFPGTDALREERRLVVANWAPHLRAHRVTFTLPLINAARHVAFLVTDGSKAEAVKRVLEPSTGEAPMPAALVRPEAGALHWFLTEQAASLLSGVAA